MNPDLVPSWFALPSPLPEEELDAIEAIGDRLRLADATVSGQIYEAKAHPMRVSRTALIERTAETEWLYARMQRIVLSINGAAYAFDLHGFSEPFQFAVYEGGARAHFDWHMDQVPARVRRKLSLTLQLSDPSRYEGGDLQFRSGERIDTAPKARGACIAFPAYTLHRVTPVTAGVRKSLVVWVEGPRFR